MSIDERVLSGYDVVIAGGGPGGCGAAIAGARGGAKTIVLERAGFLGGGMTNMMVCPFMPDFTAQDETTPSKVVNAGVFQELCQRMMDRGGAHRAGVVVFDDECAKIVLDEMMADAGVDVIFHASLIDVDTDGGRVTAAHFAHNGGPFRVEGKVFIDATGDGLLASSAGAPFEFGDDTGRVMPMTTKFIVGNVDVDRMPGKSDMLKLMDEVDTGDFTLMNRHISTWAVKPDRKWVHFNAVRVAGLNTVDPVEVSQAEAEGRQRAINFVEWLRRFVPGYENCYLVKTGAHIGIRESRRILGDYVLTGDDWRNAARFDDAIACCSYPIDIHGDKPNETRLEGLPPGEYYQIPYRSLVPRDLRNVLVASRCISADVVAHSSLRVMPTVMCLGQAAGTAAAMTGPDGDVRGVDMSAVQQTIRDAGGVLEPNNERKPAGIS